MSERTDPTAPAGTSAGAFSLDSAMLPVVWVGFDVMLLVSPAGAGVAVWLRRQAVVPLSYVAATLLICDAWFDVSLSWGRADVWGSAATAVLVELPLAVLLIVRARRVLKISARPGLAAARPAGRASAAAQNAALRRPRISARQRVRPGPERGRLTALGTTA
ncbi:hypothetical protein ACQPXS_04375 [Streptomyces sp. CA-142005]|uniref:hypothetical protein n=1 Tax=Streptomyces sp. CA-142005 TaxID=3240052 RepID=UPI003D929087